MNAPSESQRMRSVQPPVIPHVANLMRQTTGTISLGQGVVHYPPPPQALEALHSFGNEIGEHHYQAARGLPELQEALRSKLADENGIDVDRAKVLMVTGPGTSAYGTGEIWHLLDTRVDMPITMVDSHNLRGVDLDNYTHVIMTTPLRVTGATEQLDTFVKGGGVLWLQGASTVAWAADQKLTEATWRMTPSQQQAADLKNAKKKSASADTQGGLLPERKPFSTAADEYAFTLVRGAILQGDLDTSHPLGYGYSSNELAVFRTTNRFMNPSSNAYSSPVVYTDSPLLSGYMSDENRALVANSAGLVVDERGYGAVVLSLDSPTFRAFWWGTQRLLVNGIFFGDLLREPR